MCVHVCWGICFLPEHELEGNLKCHLHIIVSKDALKDRGRKSKKEREERRWRQGNSCASS